MKMLQRWLDGMSGSEQILDLGCGAGSLKMQLAGLRVIGVDVDFRALAGNRNLPAACAESHALPFASGSFHLVVANNSLEHFPDAAVAIREIGRVLKPGGRIFVSVPDGSSWSDRLYRFLFCGGGHLQRFGFESVISAMESGTGLRLAASRELFSSFNFLEKRNFLPAPRGPLPGPFPRRMRWLGHLPAWSFRAARFGLTLASRVADRWFGTSLSRYGWALAFDAETTCPEVEPGCLNVCVCCGTSFEQVDVTRVARLFYRCPYCSSWNFLFAGVTSPAARGCECCGTSRR